MLHRILMLCLLSSVLLRGEFFPSPLSVQSQDRVIVVCGTDQSTSGLLPSLFPGYFFNLLSFPQTEYIYRFERISQDSSGAIRRDEFQAPFSQEQVVSLADPLISPNGRLMAFRPIAPATDLIVWNIETDEVASVPLTTDEVTILTQDYYFVGLGQRYLMWRGSRELIIQEYREFETRPFASTTFFVNETPILELSRSTREVFQFPDLFVPENYNLKARNYSPQGTYINQLIFQGNEDRLQVFDTQSQTALFGTMSNSNYLAESAIWTSDEHFFVYDEYVKETGQGQLIIVDVEVGFRENSEVFDALTTELGGEINLTGEFEPLTSADGRNVIFNIYSFATRQDYLVFHTFATGDTTAVCNNYRFMPQFFHPFWSPDGRYFAIYYSNEELTYIFDRENGNVYGIPSGQFVGWVKGPNVPPVADAGTDQVVPPIGTTATTAQVTLDASGSTDSDGTIIRYFWTENGQQIARGVNPTVNLAPGVHTLTLEVTDHDYDVATDEVVITVSGE
jgi:hypothetical protein